MSGALLSLLLAGCGDDAMVIDEPTSDAGSDVSGMDVMSADTISCTPGAPCSPGACAMGAITCNLGRAVCVVTEPMLAGETCRDAAGACDAAEVCDGESAACPDDGFVMLGESCGDEQICNGNGMCVDAAMGTPCFTGNPCLMGELDSSSGTPVCAPIGPVPEGTVCRPSRGECDVEETCDGEGLCGEEGFSVVGTPCEGGTCDERGLCSP